MKLVFVWDRNKALLNQSKHNVTFEEAKSVFNDPFLLTIPDDSHSVEEDRYISIGYSDQLRILLVVHTEYESGGEVTVRIISSRRATSQERSRYETDE